MAAKKKPNAGAAAVNRRARFNYELGETFEAGIALKGSEVKSLREGRSSIGRGHWGCRGARERGRGSRGRAESGRVPTAPGTHSGTLFQLA